MKNWKLESEDWTRFLKWLNPDPDLAAQVHVAIRKKLVSYFIGKGCGNAEDLVDQTIDRVIRLLSSFGNSPPNNPLRFCYGVARFIRIEHFRRRSQIDGGPIPDDQPDPYKPASSEEKELLERCLSYCLQKLDVEKRDTFIRYYSVEHQTSYQIHQWLAQQLGITLNALRLRMMRVKEELRICILNCQEHGLR